MAGGIQTFRCRSSDSSDRQVVKGIHQVTQIYIVSFGSKPFQELEYRGEGLEDY